jgi:hypothetical protein
MQRIRAAMKTAGSCFDIISMCNTEQNAADLLPLKDWTGAAKVPIWKGSPGFC